MILKFIDFLLIKIKIFTIRNRLKQIKLVVTDVDGVLTDGGIALNENGELSRKFNVRDGLGAKLLKEIGIKIVFLSGGYGKSIIKRANDLEIDYCLTEVKNKKVALNELQAKIKIGKDKTLYIGDDLNDIVIKDQVSLLISPSDACNLFKDNSDFILKAKGGEGAFRELTDLILISQHKIKRYSKGWINKN